MHITKLSIAGFKSFVDPQDLLVEPGLTGIVGPNGCGKSNLLEALRWAMGASSARAMRGGEMDDLIFSGADGRPARETAEVTLVLDNSDRRAPAEFNGSDTLEVLRRLKRGAGSSYKLNGRTVRAKDIQLLFADASTGANSPSLVRQGQISELIASKPQNRRRILEEAAGIAGLNTRRHDAELKLRAAETNLDRLSEVSAEVERQLESLKRQARKARKYTALSEEIAALEAYSAHLKWSAAREELAEAETRLVEARNAVETRTRDAALAETERLRAGEGLDELRKAEAVAGAKLGQARIELARLETEKSAADTARERLQREAARLIDDMQRETDAVADAEAAILRTQDELDALPVLDETANAEKEDAARSVLEQARLGLKQAETDADAAQDALAQARAREAAATSAQVSAQKRVDHLKSQIEDIKRAQAQLADLEALSRQVDDAQIRVTQLASTVSDAEAALESAEHRHAQARDAEAESETPRAEADKALRTLEAEISGLKRLLDRGKTPIGPGIIERLKTETGFEKAVAAALGDDLQAPTDPTAAMFWAGAETKTDPLPTGAEPLAGYVDAPIELAARLSQCGVCDVADGPKLAAQLVPGQRLVSRAGHLWRWDGFVRTPEAPVSAAERLAQQAQLEAAEAALPNAKQLRDATEAARSTRRDERQAAEDAVKSARQAIGPATRQLDEARRGLASALQAAEQARAKRDTLDDSAARLSKELQAAEDVLLSSRPGGQADDMVALQAASDSAKSALMAAREAETEARGRLTDLTRGREQAVKRRDGLARDLETWTTRKSAAQARLDALVTRRREAADEASAAAKAPEALTAKIETVAQRVDALDQDRKTAADALAEREAALRAAETALRDADGAAAKARESLAGQQASLEGLRVRLDELVTLARDTFGRQPQGLLSLAQIGLSEDELTALDARSADSQALVKRRDRDALGGVNMEAESEAEELSERMGLQAAEKADLLAAIAKLREGVDALNAEGRGRLLEAFETVNGHFKALFTALFRGGSAELRLIDADDPLASGLEIFAQPPGKRLGTLSLMSGGEQALTAAALIFAVFLSRPAPICVLDEVDAPLDDANVDRFCRMLNEMRQRTDTRFIIITHNPVTMSRMDRLFGVTMREKGVSKLVSVDLGTAEELVAAE